MEWMSFECDKCGSHLGIGLGGRVGWLYALNHAGERIACPHPGELSEIEEVTGMSVEEAVQTGRTGIVRKCICLSCSMRVELDPQRDERVCPACGSTEIKTVNELEGKTCPTCKSGIVRSYPTGMIS
jgi:DNA-directed RNA polymerase subunit RPC12/RpoP